MPNRRVSFDILANDKVSATYDRIAANTGKLKARLDEIMARAVSVKIDANDKDAKAKLLDIQARLAALNKKHASAKMDIAGVARAEAELSLIDHKLDEIGRKRSTPKMGVILGGKENNRILDEILNGLGALLPVGIPAFKGLEGAAGGLATALFGAASGLGAFAAIAIPDLKTLSTNTSALTKLQTKIKNLKAQGPSSSVVRAQESLNSALAAQSKLQGSSSGTSYTLAKAQLSLAHAQANASSSTGSSASSSTALAKAQLRLGQAQTALANATPKNRAAKLYTEQQATLSLAGAQQSAAKSATSSAKTQANQSYSVKQAELSLASAKASAAKSASSSANQQAAAADRVKKAQENLALVTKDSPVNKALLQQRQLLAKMTPEERDAATQLQKFKTAWLDTQHAFEPLIFADAATGIKIARQGIQLLTPVARTGGMALGDLEKSASKALNSQYYREFFSWLAGRAGRDIDAFGSIIGNLAKGFSGLLRAFDPLANDMERGLEGASKKFANFGAGASGSRSFNQFVNYVETEGPKVLKTIADFGHAFSSIARDVAPFAGVELTILDATARMVNEIAKVHPKLIEAAAGFYILSRASKALNVAQIVTATSGFVKGIAGVGAASATADGKVGKFVARGSKVGKILGGLGGAFGLTGLAATGMGAAVLIGAAGLTYLTIKLLSAKSAQDKFYDSQKIQFGATDNNVKGYQNLYNSLSKQAKVTGTVAKTFGNANSHLRTYQQATGQAQLSGVQLADKQAALTRETNKYSDGAKEAAKELTNLKSNVGDVTKATGLSTKQAGALAWTMGIDLTKKVGTSSKAQQTWQATVQKVRDAQISARDSMLGSLNPMDRINATTQILNDKNATAAERIQAVNAELETEASDAADTANAAAGVGDALDSLGTAFGKHTTAAGRAAAVTQILTGNLESAGPKTRQLAEGLSTVSSNFKTEIGNLYNSTRASKGQAAADDVVARKHASVTKALEGSLEKMGLTAHQAHVLAQRYLAIPSNITTTTTMLKAHDVEASADAVRKKILAIPLKHTTTTSAAIASAQHNLAVLKADIKKFPPKAKVEAEAAITKAEKDLDTLESHIYTLTHKAWTVQVKANGKVVVPSLAHGPVATPDTNLLVHRAAGGFTGTGGRKGVDSIHALLAPGEYVEPSSVVDREGVGKMDALRAGRATIVPYAAGGLVKINAGTDALGLIPAVDAVTTALQAAQAYAKAHPLITPGGTGDMSAHSATAAAAQAYAKSILGSFGWGSGQMSPLISLWNGESGWNNLAQNPTSSAFGIAQFLNGTWSGKRFPKTTNYKMQVYDGMQYIDGSYGSPAAAFAAWSARSPHWYGNGLTGGVFTRPTLIGVGERGAERVDVTPINGYASGGLATTGRGYAAQLNSFVTVATSDADIGKYTQSLIDKINRHFKGSDATFLIDYVRKAEDNALSKEHGLKSSFGGKLITSINATFKDPHSAATLDQAFRDIIGRLDQGLKGSTRSGLVSYTQRVNAQMDTLATERSRIVSKLAAATALSTQVTSDARTSADISSLTAGTPRFIQIQLRNKLASISKFAANIKTLQKRGLSRDLLQQLINAGIDQGAPIAEDLVHATTSQLHSLNATERAINRSSTTLGTVAVNAQFGTSAAHSFVAGLQRQEKSLERQMAQLAKVFAKSIGKTFHLKGYASGGVISAGQIALVGENGPEIWAPGVTGSIIPNARRAARTGVAGPSADEIGQAVAAYMSTVELDLSRRGSRTVARLATQGQLRNKRLAVAT